LQVTDIVTTATLVPSNGLMTLETSSFPPGLIKDYLSDRPLGDLGATDLRRFIREATDRRGCVGSDIEIKQPVQVLAFAVAVAAAAALSYRGRESLAGSYRRRESGIFEQAQFFEMLFDSIATTYAGGDVRVSLLVDQLAVGTPVRMLPPAREALLEIVQGLTNHPMLSTIHSPTERVTVEASARAEVGRWTAYAMSPDHGVRGVVLTGGAVVVLKAQLVARRSALTIEAMGNVEKVVHHRFWRR
jgi:hypothetical protein